MSSRNRRPFPKTKIPPEGSPCRSLSQIQTLAKIDRKRNSPLPTPKLAGGSVEEIPQSCSASPRKIRGFGMTSNNSEFRISNSEFRISIFFSQREWSISSTRYRPCCFRRSLPCRHRRWWAHRVLRVREFRKEELPQRLHRCCRELSRHQ